MATEIGKRVGLTEAVPIAKALDRFDKASGGAVRKFLRRGLSTAAGGVEEGSQEALQSFLRNFTASDLVKFDEERGLFEGTGSDAGVGFTLGAFMSFMAQALGGRRVPGRPRDAQLDSPESLTPGGAEVGPVVPPPESFTTDEGGATVGVADEGTFTFEDAQTPAPAVAPEKPRRPKARATYLSDYLHSLGGIQNQGGELSNMGLDARPGMINKNGMTLDEAAYQAWEAGFLPQFTERPSVDEFLEILRADFDGRVRVFHPDDADLVAKAESEMDLVEQADRLGISTADMTLKKLREVVDAIMADPFDPRVVELSKRPDTTDQGRPTIDKTDQGEQRVIPGTERISDKEFAERRMQGKLRPKAPQKEADEGLFDTGARKQDTLFSFEEARAAPPGEAFVGFIKDQATAATGTVSRETPITRESVPRRSFEGPR